MKLIAKPIESIKKYVRAANYISAAQIYLWDNFLLEKPLSAEDIKPRLLGHWGTCPGINFIYANLNYLIKKNKAEMLFVLGPGHGFPALQANLFIEGTLEKYYPKATQDESGLGYIAKNFSFPYGFPSHSNPGAPGVILEGGELGYALATAYGAILDNPDLIVPVVIGDGEAETAATAAAWHLHRFIDPKTNGAVLPILHLNGYKISGPTIFGRMNNKELKTLFEGYGYVPLIIEGEDKNIYEKAVAVFEKAYKLIKKRNSRRPMILLKTKKGWTGIKEIEGKKIEGNFTSHQVVAGNAKTDPKELKLVEKWLQSYKFEELFDKEKGFVEEIKSIIPTLEFCMGESKYAFAKNYKLLQLPKVEDFTEDASVPGTIGSSSMRRTGLYLNEVFKLNKKEKNFRLFSPDETYSNKLDSVFQTTARAFMMKIEKWDRDLAIDGRVMEILSEHCLQGMFQGYVLTGRHGAFASYEAFIQVITSMVDQYAKFLKQSAEFPWRTPISSLNYILTSSGWRQEHNGFSHQNPGFIDAILQKQGCLANVYFPPDANSTLVVMENCLAAKNAINVIVAGKTQEPRWLTPELAREEFEKGLLTWDFVSDQNPDIILSALGDYLTKEALAAISIIKKEAPKIKIRFVNIMTLSNLGVGNQTCKVPPIFEDYFTNDKPVIFNFHGYPATLKQVLFDYMKNKERFSVHGYIENGSTTTPFDMQVRNETSRIHLAIEVFKKMAKQKVIDNSLAESLVAKYEQKLKDHVEFIKREGVDLPEIENWQWKNI
ncbi:phosphoketolase [Candidatus Nomurabacteria bacterium RIFCSPHIGHO2_01_FULL_39_9]|uniref:Phosphoketolase n=1 Tax=Candidatus Nomurabacteria bacterium RIFCSPHIGHO2_01_FULL_39_9 TaxID=1801735 RepID=A0A1F6UY45_9BACT|nr:MAG: phosphoketolase [Candidatus Nomurabacteria bacterium RIFCSPHIGHO2_01_FULL_39_9]